MKAATMWTAPSAGVPFCLGALSDDQLERALMRAKIDRAPITHADCHRVAVTA